MRSEVSEHPQKATTVRCVCVFACVHIYTNVQLCVIQTFQVADLMLTVRPLVVSVLFIRIKKFLSLVCSVRDFLLRPESNTTLLTWVIHRRLSAYKKIC